MPIRPLGHNELFLLLIQLAVLLLVARLCGELCRRIKIPAVVGELSAGVLLGPSVLGALLPSVQHFLFPVDQLQSNLLGVVTWIGVIFLLLLTGLETDLGLIKRQGRKAAQISGWGILLPFISGLALGYVMPTEFLVSPAHRTVFSLFVATAMSISAIPVIARVLMELGVIRRDIGQITLAAGMVDDTIGWILLSVVAGLASAKGFNPLLPLKALAAVGLVLVVAFTIGKRVISALYRFVDDHVSEASGLVSLTAVLVFLAAAVTLKLGLEAVLGAFIFGILLREAPRYRPEAIRSLEEVTRLIFSPIFFAAAGLKVNLTVFTDTHLLYWALVVLGVACLGKFAGAFIGARRAGLGTWEGLAIGSGMNARGAMEIIVATIGLSLGVLSIDMYSIVVFVAIATSVMAPPLLRLTLSRVKIGPEEAARLAKEAQDRTSYWATIRRLLLPTRGGSNARFAATLVAQALAGRAVEAMVLHLPERQHRFRFWRKHDQTIGENAVKVATKALSPLNVRSKTSAIKGRNTARVIAEQGNDYDLLVLGASEEGDPWSNYTFSAFIDDVLQHATRPVLVVRFPEGQRVSLSEEQALRPIRRILLPTTGTSWGKAATEFGLMLAQSQHAACTLLFVEETPLINSARIEEVSPEEGRHPLSEGEFPLLARTGVPLNVDYRTVRAARAGAAIVQVAAEGKYDLIVLSAQLRPGTRHAYLGPQVDYILRAAPCPLAVLVTQ